MMTDQKTIILHETVLQSWAKDAGSFAMAAGIGFAAHAIGVPAFEWLGAVLAFLLLLKLSVKEHRKNEVIGAKSAHDRIDEITKGWTND